MTACLSWLGPRRYLREQIAFFCFEGEGIHNVFLVFAIGCNLAQRRAAERLAVVFDCIRWQLPLVKETNLGVSPLIHCEIEIFCYLMMLRWEMEFQSFKSSDF